MGWKDFALGVKAEIKKDKVTDSSGMVTFAAFLALFPFLLFLVALASLIISPAQAQSLVAQVREAAPPQVTEILTQQIQKLGEGGSSGLLTFGALAAIWAASSGMVAFSKALNTAYDVEEKRNFFKVRGIAIGMVFVSALMMMLAGATMIVTPILANYLPGVLGTVVRLARFPIAGLIMMVMVALLYWALPDVRPRPFKFITFGSIAAVLLWLVASWGFSVYVQNFGSYEASYGAIGGIMVFLLWMYITANVMLVGAEMNAVLEQHAKATGQVERPTETESTLTSSGQDVPSKQVSESGGGSKSTPRHRGSAQRPSHARNPGARWEVSARSASRGGSRQKPSLAKALREWAVFGLATKVFGRRRPA